MKLNLAFRYKFKFYTNCQKHEYFGKFNKSCLFICLAFKLFMQIPKLFLFITRNLNIRNEQFWSEFLFGNS